MAYLTESAVGSIIDLPVCVPATEIKQGDWLVVASVKIDEPMKLTYQFLNIQLIDASVDLGDIVPVNKINGNLGLVYVALRLNYATGNPGAGGALEIVSGSAKGVAARSATPVDYIVPGTYSWILANNCKGSSESTAIIPATTSIDFKVSITGQVRLQLAKIE